MTCVVSEKGQITIPKALRDRLGLLPGQRLEAHAEGGRLVLNKIVRSGGIESVVGILPRDGGTDETIEGLRGPADL